MTPKQIIKQIVLRLFNGVDVDDLSKEEKRLVNTLEKEGVVQFVTEYVPSWTSEDSAGKDKAMGFSEYEFVYPNWEYFDEGESPAVEEPEEA